MNTGKKYLTLILLLPVLSVVLFIFWIRQKELSVETAKAYWDIFIKLTSAFTVIVSGAMLFAKYIDQQEQLHSTREAEIKRELALKEADYCRQKLNYDLENFKRTESLPRETKKLVAWIVMQSPRLYRRVEQRRSLPVFHPGLYPAVSCTNCPQCPEACGSCLNRWRNRLTRAESGIRRYA